MTTAKRAPARGKGARVRRKSLRASKKNPHQKPMLRIGVLKKDGGRRPPVPLPAKRRGEEEASLGAKAKARAPIAKPKGGPVPGTPSPMRTRMSDELQAHVRRLYEESDQPICQIALDVGVDESVIRRMGPREGWVRYVAPPRDLPPVATLLAEVEAMEAAVKNGRHPEVLAEGEPRRMAGMTGAVVLRGAQERAPQDDGAKEDNIARFIRIVMAHLDEFEAVRRAGKLIARQHLPTARAISILTEAFNKLQRLRAAQSGTIHDDTASADMPADVDAFREALAQRIENFLASRTDAGAFTDVAAPGVAATER